MSPTRRTAAPRKRPASEQVQVRAREAAGAVDAADGAESGGGPDAQAQRRQMLEEFESALREQPGMDSDGVEFLLGHFRDALESASLAPVLKSPDRASWIQALDALIGHGVLSEEDRNALVRQLDEATDPLQGQDVQIALEFAQRVQRDGEARALEWLKEQEAAAQEARRVTSSKDKTPVLPGSEAITRSRSRRLRGPPQ